MDDFTIDTKHQGRSEYVAVEVLATRQGPVLIDTGPGSTLPALEAGLAEHGLEVGDLHAVLLSHIHLDHAGAVGSLAMANPSVTVYVHERGARHLVDPAKLLASATRIYGERMDSLWGPFLAVPAGQLVSLQGGETLEVGGRRFEVIYTPGHASHHVSYLEAATRTAYVGDTGGIRVPALPRALPVTPPPDFDLELWLASVDAVLAWRPARVFRTHFGFDADPMTSLTELRRGIADWAETARGLLADEGLTDEARADRFHAEIMGWLADKASSEDIASYAGFADFRASFHGLARYWHKRALG
jgi:glyoxylase-like metal-dependent hydrolase (beta-lactamase superfamily II)